MPDLTLIIGNKNYSSWSLRPWVFMKQNNLSFNEIRVPLFTETTNDTLEQYNSDYKVPVLKDGELIVWDTLAILEYLSEKFLSGGGWPQGERARAIARSVSAEMHSSFVHLRSEMPMNCRKKFQNIQFSTDAMRDVDRVKSLWRRCRTEFASTGEWLFGDYSIADAMFAPVALRFAGYSIPLDGVEKSYVESVLHQPAIIEWIEAGKAEIEVIEGDEI
jgi:glutathione S-transferase